MPLLALDLTLSTCWLTMVNKKSRNNFVHSVNRLCIDTVVYLILCSIQLLSYIFCASEELIQIMWDVYDLVLAAKRR